MDVLYAQMQQGKKYDDCLLLVPGNIAYALFVLFCFWAGAQLLNLLVHAPGVYERLMQVQETGRPRVEIGLGVGTIFGLIPFLVGCLIFAVVALWLHWRHRRQ